MLFGRSLEKDIGPSIDEEAEIGCIRGLPSASDAISLIDCRAEFSIRRKAVLQDPVVKRAYTCAKPPSTNSSIPET